MRSEAQRDEKTLSIAAVLLRFLVVLLVLDVVAVGVRAATGWSGSGEALSISAAVVAALVAVGATMRR